ncbi:MAG: Hsp70 family protein, partial [Acidimicrobiales bacterium]|nr:Hsp70 family protein [Acidimicrobiales bacterium]
MGYFLGVDLGTTYTAAATTRGEHTEIAALSDRSSMVPSVLFLRDDDTILVGEAANRRGVTEPGRVAREFKRRFGDSAPLLLGGSPYGADILTSRLLRWVVDRVAEREGATPERIAVTHPANWGAYKLDLLRQAISLADLDDVATLSEPEAAAIHYASQARVEPGSVIAVYDLGGGTFDAAVLRKTGDGWQILGSPEGIERLGGVDFDQAVFHHVTQAVGGAMDNLDADDPSVHAAMARLRQECVDAKEALSSDSDVSIPVMLPNLQTDVRLTRAEYEGMVRPALTDTITAMNRALRSADVAADEVTAVLLVGGSSR